MEGCSRVCRAMARACASALAVDASLPRPGLSSAARPSGRHDPLWFLWLPGVGYETCLCSCLRGCGWRRGVGWTRCWLRGVLDSLGWGRGNAGLGSLWLLALQAASFGAALWEGRGLVDEAVMGWSRRLVEAEGVEGAVRFYRGLLAASPGYLGRIGGWGGLPDASMGALALRELRERRVGLVELLEAASLYDLVARDSARMLGLSLGLALGALMELSGTVGVLEAARRALFLVAAEGDMLVRRRSGAGLEGLLVEAWRGSGVAEALLYRLLRQGGPGGAADVVVAGLARLLLLWELGAVELRGLPKPIK